MKYLLNGAQMQACDTYTIEQMQVPSAVLMERAALAVTGVMEERLTRDDRVLVLCGSGNNGGDGFAVARLLLLNGIAADVFFAGKVPSMTEECARQKKIFENYGGKLCRNLKFSEYTVLVDALLGIGLSREVRDDYARLINEINASGLPVVAVDMPSGVSADTGAVMGTAVRACTTVTFAFPKLGQLLYPGADCCGELLVKPIGIAGTELTERSGRELPFYYEKKDLLKLLPARAARSNKGSYGRVLLIGGARNMAGAVMLAGRSAYRTGCGLVKIMADPDNRTVLQSGLPEAMFAPWHTENLELEFSWATVIGIGPGLGQSQQALELLCQVLKKWKGPLVVDADGLNLLSQHPEYLKNTEAKLIVTPHPGEMARLTGLTVRKILDHLMDTAAEFAGEHDLVCVLKDARTVISDGVRRCVNVSGNHGMAAGGSGDVLTGVICGLLAQGMDCFEAAAAGAMVHGLAGDRAKDELGARGMMASDLADQVGNIIKQF